MIKKTRTIFTIKTKSNGDEAMMIKLTTTVTPMIIVIMMRIKLTVIRRIIIVLIMITLIQEKNVEKDYNTEEC